MTDLFSLPLSDEAQKWLVYVKNFIAYTETPEGIEEMKKLDSFFSDLNTRKKSTVALLTKQERLALQFIRKELKEKRNPSVRTVTRAIGLSSSQSGYRVLQGLIVKGVLARDDRRYRALG